MNMCNHCEHTPHTHIHVYVFFTVPGPPSMRKTQVPCRKRHCTQPARLGVILWSDSGKSTTMGSPAVRSRGPVLVGLKCEQERTQPIIRVRVAHHGRKASVDDARHIRHCEERICNILGSGQETIPYQRLRELCFSLTAEPGMPTYSQGQRSHNRRHCAMMGS